MKNLSDTELLFKAKGKISVHSLHCNCDECTDIEKLFRELLSRLERGGKARDAMEELSKELGIICVEVLQGKYEGIRDFANAYPITFDEGTPMVRYLTEDRTDYQQSKEAADGD